MEDRTVQNNIKQFIDEELSISADVVSTVNKLSNEILGALKEKPKTVVDRGLTKQETNFYTKVFNLPIRIYAICYNFFDQATFATLSNAYNWIGGVRDVVDNEIVLHINFSKISGQVTPDFYETIQHEVEHIYQRDVIGDNNFLKEIDLYKKAIRQINSNDARLAYPAWIIYLSFGFEQDAKVNGLYAYLNNFGPMPSWSDIKNSDTYSCLTRLYKGLEFLKTHTIKDDLTPFFGLSQEQIIKRGEKTIQRFERKIGKVLIKFRNDMVERGVDFNFKINENRYFDA